MQFYQLSIMRVHACYTGISRAGKDNPKRSIPKMGKISHGRRMAADRMTQEEHKTPICSTFTYLEGAGPVVIEQKISAGEPVGGGEYGLRFGGGPVRGRRPLVAICLLAPRVAH